MKEENKPNPQYTNQKLENDSEKIPSGTQAENSTYKNNEAEPVEKKLEDKPGAFLLKDTAEDEISLENSKTTEEFDFEGDSDKDKNLFEDDISNDEALDFDPFDDEDY